MCGGPSATQERLQSEEADFYQNQISAYNAAYKNFSDLQGTLTKQFAPILNAGPGQYGYTPGEDTALRTQATEGTAQGFAAAQTALQRRLAAEGGGVSNITAGSSHALQEELATSTAAEQSRENLGITSSGYDLGRQQWGKAIAGEENLAAGWNPNAFSGSAVNAGNSAANEANAITQQQNSMWGSVLGALGGIGGAAVGNLNVGPFKSTP
jgi:hypothetical protein